MGALETETRVIVRVQKMKFVIAFAVIASLVGAAVADGSAPAGYKGEVDILPEDDELIQAKVEETELTQRGGFFSAISRLNQPAKSSWGKLKNLAREARKRRPGPPGDFPFSTGPMGSEGAISRYANVRRLDKGEDPTRHPRGGAGKKAHYHADIGPNNSDSIVDPYVPNVRPYSVRAAVRGARGRRMARQIAKMFKVPRPDE